MEKDGDSDDSEPTFVEGSEGAPVVVELPKSKKELKAERKRARALLQAPSAVEVARATRGVVLDAVTTAAVIGSDDEDDDDNNRRPQPMRATTLADAAGAADAVTTPADAVPAASASSVSTSGGKIVFQKRTGDDAAKKKARTGPVPGADSKRRNVLSFEDDGV